MGQLVAACTSTIDRASVYRTVSLFETLGVIQRLQIGWKYRIELSDKFQDHHHHLHCTVCGKIIVIAEDTVLEKRISSLAAYHNFTARDHQIEIRGRCESCLPGKGN